MEVLGQCVFKIYNNDFSYKERHCMIKKTLEAYKESRLDTFPYDELADFFSQEIGKHSAGLQDYKIDRMLVRFGCSFSVFILDEFRGDIEHPAWDDACKKVQMFFIVFSEVLMAAGRTDKIEQVPNVSYMPTMLEELKINSQAEEQQSGENTPPQEYNEELVNLFHGHTELIDSLITLTDDEKANKIINWSKQIDQQDKKKKLIDSPFDYGNATKYAKALKADNLISASVDRFRRNFSNLQ